MIVRVVLLIPVIVMTFPFIVFVPLLTEIVLKLKETPVVILNSTLSISVPSCFEVIVMVLSEPVLNLQPALLFALATNLK